MPGNSSHHTAGMPTMKNPSAVLMYDNSVRSFANSVRCRASLSRMSVSDCPCIGDPRILSGTIRHQGAKLNRPGEKFSELPHLHAYNILSAKRQLGLPCCSLHTRGALACAISPYIGHD